MRIFFWFLVAVASGYGFFWITQDLFFAEHSWLLNQVDLPFIHGIDPFYATPIANIVTPFLLTLSRSFDPEIFIPLLFIFVLFLWWRNFRFEVLFLLCGVVLGQIAKGIFKFLSDRARPDNIFDVVVHESSFPSGHSTTAVFFTLGLWYLFARKFSAFWKIISGSILLLIGLGVPFSRVYMQVHFVSDVMAGALLGGASFAITLLLFSGVEKSLSTQ